LTAVVNEGQARESAEILATTPASKLTGDPDRDEAAMNGEPGIK
jgi:hypothetical protein